MACTIKMLQSLFTINSNDFCRGLCAVSWSKSKNDRKNSLLDTKSEIVVGSIQKGNVVHKI
jgi:hypothetical protein